MSVIAEETVAAGPLDHRFAPLRRLIHPGSLGIEIGPFLNPLAAKRDGYRTLVVDRYDSSTLREKARERGSKPAEIERIEPVDYVGDASRLLDLVRGQGFTGLVDWIVSCHNFEHLPDPIRFLRDCEALLAPGGVLVMIVPDKRTCFDRFQPAATAAGMIEAAEVIPTTASEAWAAFRQFSATTTLDRCGAKVVAWGLAESDPERMLMGDPRPPTRVCSGSSRRGVIRTSAVTAGGSRRRCLRRSSLISASSAWSASRSTKSSPRSTGSSR